MLVTLDTLERLFINFFSQILITVVSGGCEKAGRILEGEVDNQAWMAL